MEIPAEDGRIKMTFGERLKELRREAGLSQDKLARACGLCTSTITKLEQASVDPAWSTVRRIAKVLGVSCSAFEGATDAGQAEPAPPAEGKPRPKARKRKETS
jgi:transcriptional regulator with XRE-family HTH domain